MIYTCVHIIIRKNRGRFVRAHSLCAHTHSRRRRRAPLSLLAEYSPAQSACVFFLAQLLLLLFKLTPPSPEFAAAHMCTCHLYLLGPRNQSRALALAPICMAEMLYTPPPLSLYMCAVYVEIYMCAFAARERENVSLAASERTDRARF
jgi:hypothetical protein